MDKCPPGGHYKCIYCCCSCHLSLLPGTIIVMWGTGVEEPMQRE